MFSTNSNSPNPFLGPAWPNGRPELWRLGDPTPALEFRGGLTELSARTYQPLALAPMPYLQLANLGRLAETVGDALVAAFDPTLRRDALLFVRDFGPLLPESQTAYSVEQRPAPRLGLASIIGPDGMLLPLQLSDFLRQAMELHRVQQLAKDVSEQPDQTKQMRVESMLRDHLDPIRLGVSYQRGEPRAAMTCPDLNAVVWLELYQEILSGRTWRICEGCQRLFTATHAAQTYCDKHCRARAGMRRKRTKEGGQS